MKSTTDSGLKIKVAEIFFILISIQGEGIHVGAPSVFIRTFGCNFQCRQFGLPENQRSDEPEQIAKTLTDESTYDSLPLAKTGCDSYASWHPQFKHLSKLMSTDEIVTSVTNSISVPAESVHVVITGGEPLLGWQRAYPELLTKLFNAGFRHVTFETNGTQELSDQLKRFLVEHISINVTFSVSPKLPSSGEAWEKAICPDTVADYQDHGLTFLKFVVATEDEIKYVQDAVASYRAAGFRGIVYLMPCGGVTSTYEMNAPAVANIAIKYGYRYSPRLQCDLWQNAWGT